MGFSFLNRLLIIHNYLSPSHCVAKKMVGDELKLKKLFHEKCSSSDHEKYLQVKINGSEEKTMKVILI